MLQMSIPSKPFGPDGRRVTIVGLGGEGVLRTYGEEQAAGEVIEAALVEGMTYFDSARAYAGSESYYGRVWRKRPQDRARIFQTSKSAMRRKDDALADLEGTLKTMGVEHLDLWQIHDIRTEQDLQIVSGPGGALEGFVEAKKQGKTRFIGVTGHHDPQILTRAVQEWPVDAVLLPVNPVEAVLGGFLDITLNAAQEKDIAVIAMKTLGASYYLSPQAGVTAEKLVRFALSYPITVAIVGCSSPMEVKALADGGRRFDPMGSDEKSELIELFRPHAERLAYYRRGH
jgi:aryl-alcohol dehydrogenase-like predicted oxidoreductase